jgi:hypothetical protein
MPNPFPPQRPDHDDLLTCLVYDSGAYADGGVWKTAAWSNDTGRALAIVGSYCWTGMTYGARADTHFEAYRESDNTQIAILQWDHYGDPNAPNHGLLRWFTPLKIMLLPGERIRFGHYFSSWSGPAAAEHRCEIYCRSGG